MIIERKIGDLNGTGAAIDGWRQPVHPAVVCDQHVGVVGDVKLAINAAEYTLLIITFVVFCRRSDKSYVFVSVKQTNLLVLKDNVRKPNSLARDPNDTYVIVV